MEEERTSSDRSLDFKTYQAIVRALHFTQNETEVVLTRKEIQSGALTRFLW